MAGSRKLQIIISGDARGALGAFAEAEKGATGFTSKLSAAAVAIPAVFAAAGVGAAAGLFKIGESFDDAYDKIRGGTGATGEALEGLKQTFKDVVSDVPASFGDASTAITKLAQITGDEGPILQGLSEQFLELSRVTRTDLTTNLDAGANALMNWNVPVTEQAAKLDELFRASQLTGVSFSDLATGVTNTGLQLRAMGFNFEETTAIVGLLGKSGFEAADVMPALGKAMAVAAKDGKDAGTLFRETFEAIKSAPDGIEASGIALDVFGAKAGPKFAELIREGQLSYEDLMKQIQGGSDTILKAGQDTGDFGEHWELLKNRIFVALEPIAMRLFDAIGDAMDSLGPKVQVLSAWFSATLPAAFAAVQPWIERIRSVLEVLGTFIVVALVPALVSFGKWLIDHKPILEGIAVAIGVGLVSAFIGWATSAAAAAIATIAAALPVIALGAVIAGLTAAVIWAYENVDWFRTTVDTLAGFLTDVVWPAIQTGADIISSFVSGALSALRWSIDTISTVIATLKDAWSTAWDTIGSVLQAIWDHTIGPIVDKISSGIDTIKSGLDTIGNIAGGVGDIAGGAASLLGFDTGGLVPGPVGAPQLAVVHGGEYVLTADQVGDIRGGGAMVATAGGSTVNNYFTIAATPGTDRVALAQEIHDILENGSRNGVRPGSATMAAFAGT